MFEGFKTPAEIKDFGFNWAPDLTAMGGDSIVTSVWTTSDPALVCTTPAPSNTPTTTTVWLSGGVIGETYTVTNTITTLGGRTRADSFPCTVRELNYPE